MPHHIGDGIEFRQGGNLFLIVQCNHTIRTQAFRLRPLAGANARNHMSAVLFGNVDSSSTDATDCASNEYDFTGPWPNADFNHLGAGQQNERQCRRVEAVKILRSARQIHRLAHHILGIGAIHQAEYSFAHLQALHPFSEGNHLTRKVAAKNCRKFERHHLLEITATQFPVDWIDAHRDRLYEHFTGRRQRFRHIFVRQLADVAITAQQNRLHQHLCHMVPLLRAGNWDSENSILRRASNTRRCCGRSG